MVDTLKGAGLPYISQCRPISQVFIPIKSLLCRELRLRILDHIRYDIKHIIRLEVRKQANEGFIHTRFLRRKVVLDRRTGAVIPPSPSAQSALRLGSKASGARVAAIGRALAAHRTAQSRDLGSLAD